MRLCLEITIPTAHTQDDTRSYENIFVSKVIFILNLQKSL